MQSPGSGFWPKPDPHPWSDPYLKFCIIPPGVVVVYHVTIVSSWKNSNLWYQAAFCTLQGVLIWTYVDSLTSLELLNFDLTLAMHSGRLAFCFMFKNGILQKVCMILRILVIVIKNIEDKKTVNGIIGWAPQRSWRAGTLPNTVANLGAVWTNYSQVLGGQEFLHESNVTNPDPCSFAPEPDID